MRSNDPAGNTMVTLLVFGGCILGVPCSGRVPRHPERNDVANSRTVVMRIGN